jgi:hypothetical protein
MTRSNIHVLCMLAGICLPACDFDTPVRPLDPMQNLDAEFADASDAIEAGATDTAGLPTCPASCDDADPCTTDSCDPSTGLCGHVNIAGCGSQTTHCVSSKDCPFVCNKATGQCVTCVTSADCDGAHFCTSAGACVPDVCTGVTCVDGTAQVCAPDGSGIAATMDCNDGEVCTTDACVAGTGCVHTPAIGACSDNNACTVQDICVVGLCTGGQTLDCDDKIPCTVDSCMPASGCAHKPDSAFCDDGNVCTVDKCAASEGCSYAAIAGPCSDGNPCTSGDACASGGCAPGPSVGCDDGNPCTNDACTFGPVCTHVPNTLPCSDGDACTKGDACASGACVPGNACSAQATCTPGLGCTCNSGLGGDGWTCATKTAFKEVYVQASNPDINDLFGSPAIDGDTMVVGTNNESSNASGVNGDQTDNSMSKSGAAYVFVRTAGNWNHQAYLKASNPNANDLFGGAVAISGDTIVVGARSEASAANGVNGDQTDNALPGSGAVYVFVRSGTVWTQQAYLKASNPGKYDNFGDQVALDGDTLVVGAGLADGGAAGVNGNQLDMSKGDSGAAYVFVRTAGVWSQQAYLKASNPHIGNDFGHSVGLSGNTIVVGAYSESSAATGVNGDQADTSKSQAGAAYVFARTGTLWTQQAYLKASNTDAGELFGVSVAVSGDTVVVGAPFEASSGTGVNGNQTLKTMKESGAAYVFVRSGVTWSQQAYVKAVNTDASDEFARSLAISGDSLVVGAFQESSSASGVNGNPFDNSLNHAGAAYLFARTGTTWSQTAYLKSSSPTATEWFGWPVAISGGTIAVTASLGSNWQGRVYVFE